MKPEIIIVDESDNIIGYMDRKNISEDNIYRATGLWIENHKGEILLSQRSFTKENEPGIWSVAVAGTVDKGETYESNMIKEAGEELGFFDFKFESLKKIRFYGKRNYFAQLFKAVTDMQIEDFVIQKEEVETLRWITREDMIRELEANPANFVPAIEKAIELTNR